jgi:hypothetical protein
MGGLAGIAIGGTVGAAVITTDWKKRTDKVLERKRRSSAAEASAAKASVAMRQAAEKQTAWTKWTFPKLLKELFLKYQPNVAAQNPSMQSSATMKALYLNMMLLGTLFLNALFYAQSGIPRDGSCSELDPFHEVIAAAIYTAFGKSAVIYGFGLLLRKRPHYEHVTTERKFALIRAWRRREIALCACGALYCIFGTIYAAAFMMVISEDVHDEFLQSNFAVFLLLLLIKPITGALLVALILHSRLRALVAAYVPDLCDFSHLSKLDFPKRCWLQRMLATAPRPPSAVQTPASDQSRETPAAAQSPKQHCEADDSRLAGAQPLEQPGDIEKLPASGAQQPVQMDAALDSDTYENLLRHFDTIDVADLQQTLCSRTSQVPDSAASSALAATSVSEAHVQLLQHFDTLDIADLKCTLRARGAHH